MYNSPTFRRALGLTRYRLGDARTGKRAWRNPGPFVFPLVQDQKSKKPFLKSEYEKDFAHHGSVFCDRRYAHLHRAKYPELAHQRAREKSAAQSLASSNPEEIARLRCLRPARSTLNEPAFFNGGRPRAATAPSQIASYRLNQRLILMRGI